MSQKVITHANGYTYRVVKVGGWQTMYFPVDPGAPPLMPEFTARDEVVRKAKVVPGSVTSRKVGGSDKSKSA